MYRAILCVLCGITAFSLSTGVWAQDSDVIKPEEGRIQPYEMAAGHIIPLAMETADPGQGGLVSAVIYDDVYDDYSHLAIPKGSKLVGREGKRVNNREEIRWDGLQLVGYDGPTIKLDRPLAGTMPDGSSGVAAGFKPGSTAAAVVWVGGEFIVPH